MSLRVFFRSSELLLPASKPYICPSCRNARSFANVASRKNTKSLDVRRFIRPRSRSASTITPVTTVHSPPQHEKDSPKTGAFKDLYLALIRVQNRRNPYLSEKLLHACTETLSTKPGEIRPVKVAVLVHTSVQSKTFLATLLADPLGPRTSLDNSSGHQISSAPREFRYGESDVFRARHNRPKIASYMVPSTFLRNNGIVLVVVKVGTMTSSKTLHQIAPIVSNEAVENFQLRTGKALFVSEDDHDLRHNFPPGQIEEGIHSKGLHLKVLLKRANSGGARASVGAKVIEVDLPLANEALENFREGTIDATTFSEAWTKSNFHRVLQWLRIGTTRTSETLPASHYELTRMLLEEALRKSREYQSAGQSKPPKSANISQPNVHQTKDATKNQQRDDLKRACEQWSKDAHTELQERLGPTELGPIWRSLAWWRLPFRADDIQANATTLIERYWLVNAERKLLYLYGRLESLMSTKPSKIGIDPQITGFSMPKTDWQSESKHEIDNPSPDGAPDLMQQRQNLIKTSVGSLAAQGQTAIINAGSKTFFTGALATLVYLSPPITSFSTLSEAAAIATLGLIYSAYGVQRRWEVTRAQWLNEVRSSGLNAIRGTEGFFRAMIQTLPSEESSNSSAAAVDDGNHHDHDDGASPLSDSQPSMKSIAKDIHCIEDALKELERVRARTKPEDEERWEDTDPKPLQSSGSEGDPSLNNSTTPGPRIRYSDGYLKHLDKRSRSQQ